ncbi:MAG: hypothetical protein D4R63_00020 [Methylococcaceae bacterium]|nr:MAG: hypothetical protein D4R63_00020 [Methylococcaceae bacterium]
MYKLTFYYPYSLVMCLLEKKFHRGKLCQQLDVDIAFAIFLKLKSVRIRYLLFYASLLFLSKEQYQIFFKVFKGIWL